MPRSDNIIPLALGGHPRSLDNLQIQPWPEAKRKDRIEVKLQCLVCSGQITLPDAQTLTARDWESAYNTYASVPCHRHRQLPASVVAYQGARGPRRFTFTLSRGVPGPNLVAVSLRIRLNSV